MNRPNSLLFELILQLTFLSNISLALFGWHFKIADSLHFLSLDNNWPFERNTRSIFSSYLFFLHPGSEAAYQVVEYKRKFMDDDSDFDEDYMPDYPEDFDQSGMLPALVVNDDFTMIEGTAICLYLADLYKQFLPDQENKAEYYR